MEITEVKVTPVDQNHLKAYATIVIDYCFVIRDLKVILGPKGYFVSMPSRKRRDGTFRDIAHPINRETREMMEQKILKAYEEAVGVSICGPKGLEDGSDLGYADDKPFSDGSDGASDYGEKPEE